VERCFLSTEEPALVAKYKRLVDLGAEKAAAIAPSASSGVLARSVATTASNPGRAISTPEQLARTAVAGPRGTQS
jgi:hypothetical protein